jgi:hypothetical protein
MEPRVWKQSVERNRAVADKLWSSFCRSQLVSGVRAWREGLVAVAIQACFRSRVTERVLFVDVRGLPGAGLRGGRWAAGRDGVAVRSGHELSGGGRLWW